MTITVDRALAIVQHAGYNGLGLPPLDYVNEAGRRLMGMHQWLFAQVPPQEVGVRGEVDFNGGTWNDSETVGSYTYPFVLTRTGAFASYTHAHGDIVDITDGTNTIVAKRTVAERINDDKISLDATVESGGTASGITGTILASNAAILPSTFGDGLVGFAATRSSTAAIGLITQQRLLELRALGVPASTTNYQGAMFLGPNISLLGGLPSYRLELHPVPTAADPKLLTLSWRHKWKTVTSDSFFIPIDEWLEPLFTSILMEIVKGYEDDEAASIEERMLAIMNGPTFYSARYRDGFLQPALGPLAGGEELEDQFKLSIGLGTPSDPA